jgi:hypothetical protein
MPVSLVTAEKIIMNEPMADEAPDAPRPPPKSLTLYVMLSRNFGSGIDCDAQSGKLAANCSAQGFVWNTHSNFESKRCIVTFRRHPTGQLLEFAHEHGLDGACGSIELAASLEPDTFDSDGEKISLPPITIYIVLDDREYDRTERLLRSSITAGRSASLSLDFSHRDFTRLKMLEDLDLATRCAYPIVQFSLRGTGQENTTVYVPKHRYDAATTASLTFTASTASIQASVWNSEFSIFEIRLAGRIRSQQLGIDSDDHTLEIKEYEKSYGWKPGYPEEAFAGVVLITMTKTITYCWVTLYGTSEILRQLATLLSGMGKGDTVRFDVTMITSGLPLKPDEQISFDVTGYTPVLQKAYS